jgi:hypothetical protein
MRNGHPLGDNSVSRTRPGRMNLARFQRRSLIELSVPCFSAQAVIRLASGSGFVHCSDGRARNRSSGPSPPQDDFQSENILAGSERSNDGSWCPIWTVCHKPGRVAVIGDAFGKGLPGSGWPRSQKQLTAPLRIPRAVRELRGGCRPIRSRRIQFPFADSGMVLSR